jgi:uncharacterized protein (DUF1778 family)
MMRKPKRVWPSWGYRSTFSDDLTPLPQAGRCRRPLVHDDRGKGSINLRIGSETRHLIDSAAGVLGKSRTEFMTESARQSAIDVLLDQPLFILDSADHEAFLQALDNPPEPGPKLTALMRRAPA